MSEDWLALLDAQQARGPDWPGDYASGIRERRARALEAFCGLLTERCRVVVSGLAAPIEHQIFWYVYSGDLGREVMALRRSPPPGFLARVGSRRRPCAKRQLLPWGRGWLPEGGGEGHPSQQGCPR